MTQRLLKAALAGRRFAVSNSKSCTRSPSTARCRKNAAEKVERQVRKSAAALLLSNRIGADV